ncbi:MAG TPA: DUF1751 domain-containing protein [Dehalococcoidia bacterium]|nr:DUF1751 domain-containing protein [Dehalococcoidia bacterium]
MNYLWIIMILNFFVFLATMFNNDLIYVFGLSPLTCLKYPWTILTSMFTHGGFWHIVANMLTLYFFGSFLIRLIGSGRMVAIYMIGGLAGNLLFILIGLSGILGGSPFAIAVGASGAVFALGGTLAILAPNIKVIMFPIPIPMPLWVAVIGGFFILSLLPGIAWEGHLGGLIIGLLAGLYLKKR